MSRQKCFGKTCDKQTTAGLCNIHRTALLQALADVHDMLDELTTQTSRQARYSASSDRRSTTTPLVFNQAASRIADQLIALLRTWDTTTADHLGHPVRHPQPRDAARYIAGAIRAGRLNTWPRLGDLLADLTHIRKKVNETIDHPTDRVPSGICGNIPDGHTTRCGAQLYTDDDHDIINCPKCGAIYAVTDLRPTMLEAADDELVLASEAASFLLYRTEHTKHDEDMLADRIRKWTRLTLRQTDTRSGIERKLYRFGDIRTIYEDRKPSTKP